MSLGESRSQGTELEQAVRCAFASCWLKNPTSLSVGPKEWFAVVLGKGCRFGLATGGRHCLRSLLHVGVAHSFGGMDDHEAKDEEVAQS